MPTTTNAMRLLRKAGIPFRTVEYAVDPEQLDAVHVARSIGQNPAQVFKTLVLTGDKGHFVCVIPGDCEVDLKKAAKAIGAKKVEMLPMKELLPLTGYIRGGCTSVGMKRQFPTFFDTTALDFETIFVSAGTRGLQLEIAPQQLIEYTRATVSPLTKK